MLMSCVSALAGSELKGLPRGSALAFMGRHDHFRVSVFDQHTASATEE